MFLQVAAAPRVFHMSDFIVVGAGLIGLLVARELVEAGATVAVVERGEPGREASWAGGGILSPLYPWRYPDPVNALARWGQAYFPRLAAALTAETGIDPEWTPSGLLMLDTGEYAAARAWAERWETRLERVTDEALAELQPGLTPPAGPALWWPDLAQVRNPRLLQALVRGLALNKRVTLHAGLAVTGLLDEGDVVRGVRAEGRELRADAVVVAAGAWSAALLGPVAGGWDIAPVRGQMLLFKAPPDLVRRIVLADGHYLVPRRDGRVLAGSTLEYVGFDKSTTPAAYRDLHAAALRLVPGLADCPVERHWAGLRPGSPAGVPLIGAHPARRGLYVNAGHFRNGVVTAPASARLLADLLLGRPPVLDPAPFRPGGAAEGRVRGRIGAIEV